MANGASCCIKEVKGQWNWVASTLGGHSGQAAAHRYLGASGSSKRGSGIWPGGTVMSSSGDAAAAAAGPRRSLCSGRRLFKKRKRKKKNWIHCSVETPTSSQEDHAAPCLLGGCIAREAESERLIRNNKMSTSSSSSSSSSSKSYWKKVARPWLRAPVHPLAPLGPSGGTGAGNKRCWCHCVEEGNGKHIERAGSRGKPSSWRGGSLRGRGARYGRHIEGQPSLSLSVCPSVCVVPDETRTVVETTISQAMLNVVLAMNSVAKTQKTLWSRFHKPNQRNKDNSTNWKSFNFWYTWCTASQKWIPCTLIRITVTRGRLL